MGWQRGGEVLGEALSDILGEARVSPGLSLVSGVSPTQRYLMSVAGFTFLYLLKLGPT